MRTTTILALTTTLGLASSTAFGASACRSVETLDAYVTAKKNADQATLGWLQGGSCIELVSATNLEIVDAPTPDHIRVNTRLQGRSATLVMRLADFQRIGG